MGERGDFEILLVQEPFLQAHEWSGIGRWPLRPVGLSYHWVVSVQINARKHFKQAQKLGPNISGAPWWKLSSAKKFQLNSAVAWCCWLNYSFKPMYADIIRTTIPPLHSISIVWIFHIDIDCNFVIKCLTLLKLGRNRYTTSIMLNGVKNLGVYVHDH